MNKMLPIDGLPFDRTVEERLDANRPFHHWYATTTLLRPVLRIVKSCLSLSFSSGQSPNHQS